MRIPQKFQIKIEGVLEKYYNVVEKNADSAKKSWRIEKCNMKENNI